MNERQKIEVTQRGEGPYEVWSGPKLYAGRFKLPPQFPPNEGHKKTKPTFLEALREIFERSNAGYSQGAYIRDANGEKIFDTMDEQDKLLLANIDEIGFVNLVVVIGRE